KAHQGNILEAINLGINSFSSNYVDRDLSRTGLSTIVVTPSFGVFDVSKRLLRMTTERMLHFGLRVDFVCLAPRPLFRPPVFRFKSYPVPTEQEQRRALGRAAQAERDARRAKETEISTVSPLAESPGPHSGGPPFSSGNAPKDRGPKVMVGSNSGHSIVIDPLMLDPLYFDDEKWVNELLPHVSGAAPRALFGGGAADGSRKTSGAHYSKQSNLGNVAADTSNSHYSASVISALIGDRHDIDPSEIPDTIKDLHGDQFPFFAQQQSLSRPDERAVYYYFAYWVDSGFYNYTDQSVAHHSGDFSPVCKMGELSVTGVANYMRQRPMIPDLDLVKAVNATAGADTDYTASIAGYDTRTMGSSSDSPGHDALRARSEEFRSAEAQMVAMARDVSHGRVLRSDRLSSVHGHERLLEMFAKFDRQAIVGTGTPWSANSTGNGASGLASGLVNTGSIAENRNTLGHIPTPLHLSQHSTAIVPSNASAHWDEQFGYNIARAPDSRATERVDIGVSSSAEPAEILPAVSSSASPNLRHSQYIKPPARSEHDSNMSSSVPRESKLSGHNHPGAVIPRTSVFMRSNPPAKRAVPAPPDKQLSDPVRHVEASSMDRQRHSIAGPSSLHDMNMQVPPRARGTTPDAGGARQGVHRVSESPQSIDYTRDSLGTINRSTSGLLATQGSNNERIAVSESIARQSHLEDHIRTFRGTSGSHEAQHHTQLPPAAQASATSVNAGIGPRHSTQEGDFQLTFPAGRQVTVPFSATTAPSQPSAPQAPDYHSGSPQYNKAGWLDRLSAHGPDAGTSRALHRRHYELYNPCNPERHPLARTELSQRWTYAFPTYSLLSSFTPKWRSLCTPASLPLVTDYYPTDLGSFYRHYFYHIKTPDINAEDFVDLPQEDYTEFSQFMATRTQLPANMATRTDAMQRTDRSTFIMLKEMVYQRLAQGFQFINMDCTMGPRSRDTTRQMVAYRWPMHSGRSDSDRLGVRPLADYTSGSMQTTDRSIWLSNGRQIQKLEFQDNSSSTHMPGVLVTRWERNKPFDQSDLRYRFQMWSRNNNMGYCADDTRFSYPMDEEVNWNNLDYLITGYRSNLTRAMRYWRTRYVLIPMEQLGNDTIVNTKSSPHMSNEDMRIANFEKFLDHILRLLRKDEKNKLEDRFLGLLPSELRRSTYVFGSQHDSSRRGTHRSSGNGSQPALSQQQQQQQFPAPPPQLAHAASIHDTRKAIGLSDLVPSSLMQVRYTTLYPVT
ncbi:vacuolar membrane-associated protein iml1, partial [Coemansia sp. RSA 2618]